ncbi:hypothetical protein BN2364_0024 [Alloalcanivorax xenomutans]|nr:hypothetical protein BN2364_0024 [Alloalcanivorax xenomutans]
MADHNRQPCQGSMITGSARIKPRTLSGRRAAAMILVVAPIE